MFFSLQQSAFLHALGGAIGNSLWQIAALWLVFAAISGVTKMNPANRYRLALFFSTAGFLWFIISLIIKYVSIASLPVEVWNVYDNVTMPIVANGFSNNVSFIYHSLVASLTSLSPYISCAYLLVWALLATRLVNGFRQVKQFGTQGLGKVHIDLKLFVQQHAALLQIKKKVKIFTSAYVQSPLTIGFFKPLILLPVASLSHLSTAQVEAILLHELAHIKRHDYLVNIFVQVAEITLFFNPFMRLLLKQIKQERENCCDDYVLQFQYNAADYAKALLGIAKNRTATLLAMGAKNNNNQFQLLNRVKRMVAPQPQTFNYRQQLYMLCLITILGLGVTMIVPNSSVQPKKEKTTAKTITETTTISLAPAVKKEIKVEPPAPPKPYDFVKSMESLGRNLSAKNIDYEEVQRIGDDVDSHTKEIEEQTKQITATALKNAQPEIDRAGLLAKKLAERFANLDKQKNLENGNFDGLISTITENINETVRQMTFKAASPRRSVKTETPIVSVAPARFKFSKQPLAERKVLMTKEQLENQQADSRKTMDSLQSAMAELRNTKTQEALNKIQAKLDAFKSKEDWDIAFNENTEDIKNATNNFTIAYTNKMGKMIKKWVNSITADIDIKDLNDLQIQLKSELDKIQSDKINIQIGDKHQERFHKKNNDININIMVDDNSQGS